LTKWIGRARESPSGDQWRSQHRSPITLRSRATPKPLTACGKRFASDVRIPFFIFFSEYPEGKGDDEGEEELAATFFNSLLNTDT
jgi:hypothetical protein